MYPFLSPLLRPSIRPRASRSVPFRSASRHCEPCKRARRQGKRDATQRRCGSRNGYIHVRTTLSVQITCLISKPLALFRGPPSSARLLLHPPPLSLSAVRMTQNVQDTENEQGRTETKTGEEKNSATDERDAPETASSGSHAELPLPRVQGRKEDEKGHVITGTNARTWSKPKAHKAQQTHRSYSLRWACTRFACLYNGGGPTLVSRHPACSVRREKEKGKEKRKRRTTWPVAAISIGGLGKPVCLAIGLGAARLS